MNLRRLRRCIKNESGQSLVEFSLSALMLTMLLLGMVDISRLLLVYTTVANAARAGTRYAVVHGADDPATVSQVQTVVKNFLAAAPLNTAATGLTIGVTYAGNSNAVGSTVTVTVVYPYDPLTKYFPLHANLGSTSQGVIVF
ncbi:MAG: pilus assembly protein [Acidobacteriaceae bacterium]|nr:pilus assembly protein [Acidobacteriaceae bacterium]